MSVNRVDDSIRRFSRISSFEIDYLRQNYRPFQKNTQRYQGERNEYLEAAVSGDRIPSS